MTAFPRWQRPDGPSIRHDVHRRPPAPPPPSDDAERTRVLALLSRQPDADLLADALGVTA